MSVWDVLLKSRGFYSLRVVDTIALRYDYTSTNYTLVAQWIEQPPPKRSMMVRVRPGVFVRVGESIRGDRANGAVHREVEPHASCSPGLIYKFHDLVEQRIDFIWLGQETNLILLRNQGGNIVGAVS